MNTTDLRIAAQAVFLVVEPSVAQDLADRLKWAANEIDRLTLQLAEAKTQTVVPDNWKLVPVEPTNIMMEIVGPMEVRPLHWRDELKLVYAAMIGAAPKPKI